MILDISTMLVMIKSQVEEKVIGARRQLFIISGERNVGKSFFCAEIVKAAKRAGFDVAGILSPAVDDGGERRRIDVQDVRSGARKALAYAEAFSGEGPVTEHWHFDDRALSWGNEILGKATPCDVLVVDEIGPLEFRLDKGWKAGITLLDGEDYWLGFVVIRAELVEEIMKRWTMGRAITLTKHNRRWMIYRWYLNFLWLKILISLHR
jgi:nucleoside-triphosphatase THEP1